MTRDIDDPREAGVTLIETVVVMTILSFLTAIVTTGIVGVLRQQRASVAFTDAQTQAARALQRLDAEIRYAGDIRLLSGATAKPMLPDPSVVWVAVDPDSSTSTLRCVAISLKNGALQRRQWATSPAGGAIAAAAPLTLVPGVSAVSGQPPFVVDDGLKTITGDGDPVIVRGAESVDVNLQVSSSGSAGRALLQHFTALNSLQGGYSVSGQCF
ncbi:PulJ/GspJ family protein [Actinoplanes sp. CA-030573]|uniref:PulJ/GspJ family protein n=1 Tax=Actinoplanes sp. CA-030573 TaxID=3239898 RepID=UPI003D8EBB85